MPKRLLRTARGFVHDITTVASLSDEQANIRVLSDRTLYVLQNLSGEDITFLSRYGDILSGGYYDPVTPGTDDASLVYDTVQTIRRDLIDMTIQATLQCICDTLSEISASISMAQAVSCGCEIGTDVDTDSGSEGGPLPGDVNGVPYEAPSAIPDRKCLAANYIHGSVKTLVNEFKLQRVDQYGYAGLAAVLQLTSIIIGTLLAGPVGALTGAVVGSTLAMSVLMFKAAFSLTLLLDAIEDDEQAAICALYEATTASGARAAYEAYLVAGGATSLEIEFVEYLLPNNVLNLLFFAWGDSEDAIENTPVIATCTACAGVLDFWDFVASLEGWTCNDLSTPPATASCAHDGTAESKRDTFFIPQTPNASAFIENVSPALSHANDNDLRLEWNWGPPSDGINTSFTLVGDFDVGPAQTVATATTTAGMLGLNLTGTENLIGVRLVIGRAQGGSPTQPFNFTVDNEDVTILRT